MFVPPKSETKNTEIDSIDFKNENLTTKIRRNKAKKTYFFKKLIPKDLEIIQMFFFSSFN